MNGTNETAKRLSPRQLVCLDAYVALQILEAEAVGTDALPLYDALAEIRKAWSSTEDGHAVAWQKYQEAISTPEGRAALEVSVITLALSARRPALWTEGE